MILIRANKVEAVGHGLDIPAGAKLIDLSRMTVLPGLIDCHTHLADGAHGEGDPISQLKKSAARVVLESVPNARVTLEAGFTTVRDVGVYRVLNDVALRDAIHRGDVIGPRIVLSSGAVLTHGSNPNSQEFTLEELQAAVDEASHFGLRVEAHAHSASGIKNAIRAGVASVEHATMIDDEGIALAKQHGTYLDMDIYDEECIQEDGRKGKMPKDFLEHDRELGQIQRDNFRKAVQAGLKMSFGTDAGVCAYGQNAKPFAWMVKYRMTSMQAIQSATSSAADLLGRGDELGSIKPGKYADVIAVSGDPLENVSLLANVQFVMKDAKVYRQ